MTIRITDHGTRTLNELLVIVGSSAGALIGLQFVVTALVADLPRQGKPRLAMRLRPHHRSFRNCVAAVSCSRRSLARYRRTFIGWGLIGLGGLVYAAIVTRGLRRQTAYQPVFEDWLFHALLPLAAYAMLAASAWEARAHAHQAMFGVAATALLLLFIGIS